MSGERDRIGIRKEFTYSCTTTQRRLHRHQPLRRHAVAAASQHIGAFATRATIGRTFRSPTSPMGGAGGGGGNLVL